MGRERGETLRNGKGEGGDTEKWEGRGGETLRNGKGEGGDTEKWEGRGGRH